MHTNLLWRVFVAAAFAAVCLAAPAESHDLSHSQSDTVVSGAEARARIQLDLVGFSGMQWRQRDVVSYEELDERIEQIFALLKAHLQTTSSATLVGATVARYGLIDNHVLDADVVYRFDRPIDDLVVRSSLEKITSPDHQHLARVTYAGRTAEALLTVAVPSARFERQVSPLNSFFNLLEAGAWRVLTGPDYLAFLLLVILAVPNGRSLRTVLVAATTAACIAFVIGATGVLPFSAQLLALLVPLVVVISAAASVFGGRLLDQVLLASVFALVQMLLHASALRGQAFTQRAMLIPLLAFSIGLFLTQIALAIIALPAARLLASSRILRPAVSVAAAAIAVYWLVQRGVAV